MPHGDVVATSCAETWTVAKNCNRDFGTVNLVGPAYQVAVDEQSPLLLAMAGMFALVFCSIMVNCCPIGAGKAPPSHF